MSGSERRHQGVTTTTADNGSSYTLVVKRVHAWVAFVAALLAIGTTVYGAARVGVRSAVQHEIEHQIQQANSPLNRQVVAIIEKHETDICEPRWRAVQDSLTDVNTKLGNVDGKLTVLLQRQP